MKEAKPAPPKYKFSVAICPLCHSDLQTLSGIVGPNHFMWGCSVTVCPYPSAVPVTHYQVEWDKDTGVIAQHMVVPPFYLDTFNTDWQTRIHTAGPNSYMQNRNQGGSYIVTVPQIHPDTPDKLLERVRLLVLFS